MNVPPPPTNGVLKTNNAIIKEEEKLEDLKNRLKPTTTIVKTRSQMFKQVDEDTAIELSEIDQIERKMIKISDIKQNTPKFSLMTHNILADCYTSFNMFPFIPKTHLIYSFRKQSLLREFKTYDSDILCLQELENTAYDDFYLEEMEKEGYLSEYCVRTSMRPWKDPTTNSKWEGVGIFFKKSKFELISKYEFYFNMIAYEQVKEGKLNESDLSTHCMMSHNVALCLILKSIETSKFLIVSTTHANWKWKDVNAQLWQNKTHYEQVQKVSEKFNQPCETIITGDFNSIPSSKVYNFFSEKLKSAYQHFPNQNEAPITSDGGKVLDYIWYSNGLKCCEILDIPNEFNEKNSFPSSRYPSDHIALMSTFSFE
jgi:CCR4-NOT transcription complex subunit 6